MNEVLETFARNHEVQAKLQKSVSRRRSRFEQKLDILGIIAEQSLSPNRISGLTNLPYMVFLSIQKELVEAGVLQKEARFPHPVKTGPFNLLKEKRKERWKRRYFFTITEKGLLTLRLHRQVKELLGEPFEITSTA